ncbi:hypothetical protein [Alistipes sp.]|uniref:hypothetical protein n=1 Tax=Alistipes sp. TaxID=1872444 RepID=UPI003AEF6BA3
MKGLVRGLSAVVAAVALFASCSKDKDSGSLSLDKPAVFLRAGQTVTVGFSGRNIRTYSVTSKPEGWPDPVLDVAAMTLSVTAPATFDDGEDMSGSFVLTGAPYEGSVVSASLFAAVATTEDRTAEPANSYLLTKPETNYLFDARCKGEGRASLATASVGVIWQTAANLIQYLTLDGDKASFYVGAADDGKIKEGNALIGAYDADGTLLWSWHIWTAADFDAEGEALDYSGLKVMSRNLGALKNANATFAEIFASYGLYYQWGRKDPFIGPATYNAANGAAGTMYNGSGSRVYLKTVASDSSVGTEAYALQNPLTFITGNEDSENDWLWTSNDALWGETKTVNDPCPYGWKVAPATTFNGMTIVGQPVEADVDKYGWTLARGGVESLYIGAGRRRYDDGTILNVYNPLPLATLSVRSALEAQPWEGLYWTTGTQSGARSSALHFWFEKLDTTGGVENGVPYARANGMQVRCVKAVQ